MAPPDVHDFLARARAMRKLTRYLGPEETWPVRFSASLDDPAAWLVRCVRNVRRWYVTCPGEVRRLSKPVPPPGRRGAAQGRCTPVREVTRTVACAGRGARGARGPGGGGGGRANA